MAQSTVYQPRIAIATSGSCSKQGAWVNYRTTVWTTASNVTIPSGYRPSANAFFVGEIRTGDSGTRGFGRITFNVDGTVTLESGYTQFVGTFNWSTY